MLLSTFEDMPTIAPVCGWRADTALCPYGAARVKVNRHNIDVYVGTPNGASATEKTMNFCRYQRLMQKLSPPQPFSGETQRGCFLVVHQRVLWIYQLQIGWLDRPGAFTPSRSYCC